MHDGHEGTKSRVLSGIDRRILELLATGLGTPEIADRLGLPVSVVRATLCDVIAKVGARSRLEALLIAFRRGLIDLPPE